MIRVRHPLIRRFNKVRENPRHFLQLLLPATLILLGWLALVLEWNRTGVILVSAALTVFAGLLWMRLRRIQARIDKLLRRTAALQTQTSQIRTTGPPPVSGASSTDTPPVEALLDEPSDVWQNLASPASAIAAGVPPGLARALREAALQTRDETLLVVPESLRDASVTWANAASTVRWGSVDQRVDGMQRSRAASLDVVIIIDGPDQPDFRGVLDQSFFWWLPQHARLFLVSEDVSTFARRLAAAHDVEFALAQRWRTTARILVTRSQGIS